MRKILSLLVVVWFVPSVAWAGDDPHGYAAVYEAITSSFPQEMVEVGREMDDQMMSQGQDSHGQKVYLVTDKRSRRVNAIVDRLLTAMGADPSAWIVRVLDTEEPVVNAFVFGGRYIYVYTGFLAQAQSDDEIAVVLGHEIGHSVLKHLYRRVQHQQNQKKNLGSFLMAVLGGSTGQQLKDAAYSRLDEEEADVFGVTIARRAGYDPLRGADFFTRLKRHQDEAVADAAGQMNQAKAELDQLMADCAQNTQIYNSSRAYQTQENYQKVVAMCDQAEAQRIAYNEFVPQYNAWMQQLNAASFYSDHPMDQSRIAAVAALNDYLEGRRPASSLMKYKQTYNVVIALQDSGSVLLKEPKAVASHSLSKLTHTSGGPLVDQLRELEAARDKGLITADEYAQMRTDALYGD